MIQGVLRENKTSWLLLAIEGSRGSEEIEVMVDSGFTGDLCVPVPVAVKLGLELIGTATIRLADGSTKVNLVFRGSAFWGDRWLDVQIMLTNSDKGLVGDAFLSKLEAKFAV